MVGISHGNSSRRECGFHWKGSHLSKPEESDWKLRFEDRVTERLIGHQSESCSTRCWVVGNTPRRQNPWNQSKRSWRLFRSQSFKAIAIPFGSSIHRSETSLVDKPGGQAGLQLDKTVVHYEADVLAQHDAPSKTTASLERAERNLTKRRKSIRQKKLK